MTQVEVVELSNMLSATYVSWNKLTVDEINKGCEFDISKIINTESSFHAILKNGVVVTLHKYYVDKIK